MQADVIFECDGGNVYDVAWSAVRNGDYSTSRSHGGRRKGLGNWKVPARVRKKKRDRGRNDLSPASTSAGTGPDWRERVGTGRQWVWDVAAGSRTSGSEGCQWLKFTDRASNITVYPMLSAKCGQQAHLFGCVMMSRLECLHHYLIKTHSLASPWVRRWISPQNRIKFDSPGMHPIGWPHCSIRGERWNNTLSKASVKTARSRTHLSPPRFCLGASAWDRYLHLFFGLPPMPCVPKWFRLQFRERSHDLDSW